jgi:tetratricopeptide (TPR) repeat protein
VFRASALQEWALREAIVQVADSNTPTPNSAPDLAKVPAQAGSSAWRDVWQLPTLLGAGLVLLGGAVYGFITKPKPNVMTDFSRAQDQIDEKRYADAVTTLNQRVLPVLSAGGLNREQEQGFYLMRARALALGQREAGVDRVENHENIVAEYERAERLGATLAAKDEMFIGDSLRALGELDKAAKRIVAIPDEYRDERILLLKRLIEQSLENKKDQALALELLGTMNDDVMLPAAERLWSLSRQAKLLLAQGYAEDAATRILRTMPRVMGEGDPKLKGEVLITLARAYIAQGDMLGAGVQLKNALAAVGEETAAAAEIYLLQGQVAQDLENHEEAREKYIKVIEGYEYSPFRAEALLGKAEVEARLVQQDRSAGSLEQALRDYELLVDSYESTVEKRPQLPPERVVQSLMARYREQFDTPDYRTALRVVALAERLYRPDDVPTDMLLALAESRRRIAEELLATDDGRGLRRLSQVDPTTQREARQLLLTSGEYYNRHADKVVQLDPRAYADSLWNAADCFDRAGDTREAIRAFQQFAGDFPSDPRQPEAKFRLGEAYRAEGEITLAEQVFRDLMIDQDGTGRAGPFADASYVPLAQTMLSDDKADNDAEAERLLREVVTGRIGGPGTERYREALRELGDYYYRTGRYEPAIERFEEYLTRSEGEPVGEDTILRPGPTLIKFKLGDSYRLSARGIEKALTAALPDSDARELRTIRGDRLARAAALFEQVSTELDARQHRSAFEDLCLRNSYFYRGDCAYDLADYETAIRHYEAARERYPKDPASLVAMTQIVSALIEQGETQRAIIANQRAKKFYESLPESVWDDPTLPLGKREWERWLAAQSNLADLADKQAQGKKSSADARPGEHAAGGDGQEASGAGGE